LGLIPRSFSAAAFNVPQFESPGNGIVLSAGITAIVGLAAGRRTAALPPSQIVLIDFNWLHAI